MEAVHQQQGHLRIHSRIPRQDARNRNQVCRAARSPGYARGKAKAPPLAEMRSGQGKESEHYGRVELKMQGYKGEHEGRKGAA